MSLRVFPGFSRMDMPAVEIGVPRDWKEVMSVQSCVLGFLRNSSGLHRGPCRWESRLVCRLSRQRDLQVVGLWKLGGRSRGLESQYISVRSSASLDGEGFGFGNASLGA